MGECLGNEHHAPNGDGLQWTTQGLMIWRKSSYFGDLAGQRLYAVSLYPERSVVIEGKHIPLAVLRRFFLDNRDLWVDPRVSVGTWFSADGNMTYLDISATIPDRELAIQLGKRYNQISVFDLFSQEEIQTGGTGEAVPSLPPADERLPEFAFSSS